MTPSETTLARLADAATPGPWIKSTRGCDAMISTEALGFLFPALGNSEGAHQDAEFIAAANPSAIKSILARIERQDRALKYANTYVPCITTYEHAMKVVNKINAILGGENTKATHTGPEGAGDSKEKL